MSRGKNKAKRREWKLLKRQLEMEREERSREYLRIQTEHDKHIPVRFGFLRKRQPYATTEEVGAYPLPSDFFLPMDVIENILIRLSPNELLRLKAVCKQWCELIEGDHFVAAHLARSRTTRTLILRQRSRRIFSFNKEDESEEEVLIPLPWKGTCTRLCSSCNGLLLFYHKADGLTSFYVGNPATGEIVELPSLLDCWIVIICQLVHDRGRYKVLLIYHSHDRRDIALIFTIATDFSWRTFPTDYQGWASGMMFTVEFPWINGALHRVYDDLGRHAKHWDDATRFVAAFDIGEERLREIKYPRNCCPASVRASVDSCHYHSAKLVELRGMVCMLHFDPEMKVMGVWFLVDYYNQVWSKDHSVDFSHIHKEFPSKYDVPGSFASRWISAEGRDIHPFAKLNVGGESDGEVLLRFEVQLETVERSVAFLAYHVGLKSVRRVKLFGIEFDNYEEISHTLIGVGGNYVESLVRVRAH